MTTVPTKYLAEPLKPDRALSDAVDTLLTGDIDRDGRCILTFEPDASLSSRLQIRLMELRAALLPARPADLATAVAQLLLGFGSTRSSEDAEAIVTQYVTALAHLPLWAVQRACLRFARGSVTKTECPDWKPAYAPSTAQLCRLAQGLVHELWSDSPEPADQGLGCKAALRTPARYQWVTGVLQNAAAGFRL